MSEITQLQGADLLHGVSVQPKGLIPLPLISEVQAKGKTDGHLPADISAMLKCCDENKSSWFLVDCEEMGLLNNWSFY